MSAALRESSGVVDNRTMSTKRQDVRGLPRAVPQRSPGKRIVEAILQGAGEVLGREGFVRLTTNRIAQHAGVSIGSVYQYFPDKHAVVAAIGRSLEQRALELFRNATRALGGAKHSRGSRQGGARTSR